MLALPMPHHDITEFEARRIFARTYVRQPVNRYEPQPTMRWFDGIRVQPRDGRGRFLPRVWLADAELFLPADRAWFRSPIATEAV